MRQTPTRHRRNPPPRVVSTPQTTPPRAPPSSPGPPIPNSRPATRQATAQPLVRRPLDPDRSSPPHQRRTPLRGPPRIEGVSCCSPPMPLAVVPSDVVLLDDRPESGPVASGIPLWFCRLRPHAADSRSVSRPWRRGEPVRRTTATTTRETAPRRRRPRPARRPPPPR